MSQIVSTTKRKNEGGCYVKSYLCKKSMHVDNLQLKTSATHGPSHPHVANHNRILLGDLIMTDINIHNFQYFLKELRKNLNDLETFFEKESIALESMNVLHTVMAKMCENWENQLDHQQ